MRILLTGGAGYIGSTTTDHLLRAGHNVTVFDNLSHGYKEAVPPEAAFVKGDIHDISLLQEVMADGFDAIMHFAAFIEAGESMKDPMKYYANNVVGSQRLFQAALEAGITKVIFSSTAAVYQSKDDPITENDTILPVNVYGQTKRVIEEMLWWLHQTKGLQVGIFRYFNAAGASQLHKPPVRGEAHQPETHIVPNILDVALGKKEHFTLFGNDYPTPDGTCIRDYIHVDDLAEAHVKGLELLTKEKFSFEIFNLGNGQGFSNLEVVQAARNITGKEIPVVFEARREGDAPRLVASSQKAQSVLDWKPEKAGLDMIIASAWEWHQRKIVYEIQHSE